MNEMLRRRPRSIAAIAAGAAAVLLMGGLVAMTSDSIRSQGNNARSGEYTPPAHDLQIAVISSTSNVGKDCTTATYTDADTVAVMQAIAGSPLGWGSGQLTSYTYANVCLKNAGPYTGQLVFSAENVVDTEVGACAPNEATLGNDPTCAAGDPGELSQVFTVAMAPRIADGYTSPGASCSPQRARMWAIDGSPLELNPALAPGQICAFASGVFIDFGPLYPEPDEATKALTQTDETTWDYVFTLQDAEV